MEQLFHHVPFGNAHAILQTTHTKKKPPSLWSLKQMRMYYVFCSIFVPFILFSVYDIIYFFNQFAGSNMGDSYSITYKG